MTAARSSTRADAEHARQQQLEHQQVIDACKELATLWPHLIDALPRDSASSGADTNGGSNTTAALVNHDVAEATTQIRRWTASAYAECHRILKAPWPIPADTGNLIASIPIWHFKLQQLNLPTAGYLAADAGHAQHTARRALHLTEPSRRLGHCPEHPETQTPLIKLGQEGHLDEAIIDGTAIRCTDGTTRLTGGAITWSTGVVVRCPVCRTTWAGPIALLALSQKITEQTRGDTT